ncbi:hypothetical protein M0C34_08680 [Agarivorans sp. TSD2052]|uniref:GFA family protein n=1 Tax=Agarivorans sp. TSD2052 TaxID=2937286 RepID=UPI0020104BEF|nr:hypothetical protein [Agarivorans sp. TSD2052]UPW20319.1 hypothetical protein M0C34_08680 [Agarivorans sp. TSD2052]
MKYTYSGTCKCGEVTVSIELPYKISKYSPRTCDCDYCIANNVSYISDPAGSLKIVSAAPLKITKQGAELADFLCCSSCDVLISVVYNFQAGIKGAVNVSVLDDLDHLKEGIRVSPKLLEPSEKLKRWESMWLSISVEELARI